MNGTTLNESHHKVAKQYMDTMSRVASMIRIQKMIDKHRNTERNSRRLKAFYRERTYRTGNTPKSKQRLAMKSVVVAIR